MEHAEHLKKIKNMVGDFLGEIAEEKRVTGSNIAVVKEAVSAYQKLCDLCEEEAYGTGMRYSARRRDSRGRYMTGGYSRGGYGYMPGPYFDGGPDELADELDQMAQSGGSTEKANALREAARWLRQG